MLIGLCGPPCSGKSLVAEHLVHDLGFSLLDHTAQLNTSSSSKIDSDITSEVRLQSRPLSPSLVSQCWRQDINIVIRNVNPRDSALPDLLKRPYFLLVYVDAPLLVRFRRAIECKRYSESELELFVADDDALNYDTLSLNTKLPNENHERSDRLAGQNFVTQGDHSKAHRPPLRLSDLDRLSRLRVSNIFSTRADLNLVLRAIRFTDPNLLRPSWDTYFMSLAKLAAERTNCMKRRVGCVIVRNKRIVATGYNGTPSNVKNCADGGCPRCNSTKSSQGFALDLCLCLHAEENAIVEAGRERCEGSTLYTNLFPCILCSKKIVQAGVSRVVFDKHYATDEASDSLLRAGGVLIDSFIRDSEHDSAPPFSVRYGLTNGTKQNIP